MLWYYLNVDVWRAILPAEYRKYDTNLGYKYVCSMYTQLRLYVCVVCTRVHVLFLTELLSSAHT